MLNRAIYPECMLFICVLLFGTGHHMDVEKDDDGARNKIKEWMVIEKKKITKPHFDLYVEDEGILLKIKVYQPPLDDTLNILMNNITIDVTRYENDTCYNIHGKCSSTICSCIVENDIFTSTYRIAVRKPYMTLGVEYRFMHDIDGAIIKICIFKTFDGADFSHPYIKFVTLYISAGDRNEEKIPGTNIINNMKKLGKLPYETILVVTITCIICVIICKVYRSKPNCKTDDKLCLHEVQIKSKDPLNCSTNRHKRNEILCDNNCAKCLLLPDLSANIEKDSKTSICKNIISERSYQRTNVLDRFPSEQLMLLTSESSSEDNVRDIESLNCGKLSSVEEDPKAGAETLIKTNIEFGITKRQQEYMFEDEMNSDNYSVTSTASSITISWSKQHVQDNLVSEEIKQYETKYRQSGGSWKILNGSNEGGELEITGLLSDTLYEINVYWCGVSKDAKRLFAVCFKTKESIQKFFMENALADKSRRPFVYHLNPVLIAENKIIDRIRDCDMNYKPAIETSQEKTLLLLGATETEKSTLINVIIDNMAGVSFDDDHRFVLIYRTDEKKERVVKQEQEYMFEDEMNSDHHSVSSTATSITISWSKQHVQDNLVSEEIKQYETKYRQSGGSWKILNGSNEGGESEITVADNKPGIDTSQEKTLLLLGVTGKGKSTFIDAFINFIIANVSYDDDHRFGLITKTDEEKERVDKQSQSQTTSVTVYRIPKVDGFQVSYQVNMIDTPGFNDTRGTFDKRIIEQIKELFERRITHLDAILVIPLSTPRLTEAQKEMFSNITRLFGEDIVKNIFIAITWDGGGEATCLTVLRADEIPVNDTFRFNNASVLGKYPSNLSRKKAEEETREISNDKVKESQEISDKKVEETKKISNEKVEETEETPENMHTLYMVYWDKRNKSFSELFKKIQRTIVKSSIEVMRARRNLKIRLASLKDEITEQAQLIANLIQDKGILLKIEYETPENKKKALYSEIKIEMQPQFYGKPSLNCRKCRKTCHRNCWVPTNLLNRTCEVMENETCTVCKGRCGLNDHTLENYVYEPQHVTKLYSGEDVVNRQIEREIAFSRFKQILVDTGDLIDLLNKNALKKNVLTLPRYIQDLISKEKEKKIPGFIMRIQLLEKICDYLKRNDSLLKISMACVS